MPARGEASGWERVLVRHIVSADRNDIHRLGSLVHAPFGDTVLAIFNSGADLSFPPPPSDRWMIAARFAKESWLSLFSGATGQELFDANAESRRMEVAWVGCQPEGVGWFVRINRAAKPVVEFAKGVQRGATPTLHSTAIEPDFLRDGETGEHSFRQVCTRFEVSIPAHEVRATDRGFVVVGANGRPVKSALRGFILALAPAISAGENAAADALAEAIDRCDVDGIGGAINRGAPLTVLPSTFSVSPLLSVLYKYSKCDRATWDACLQRLLAGGCPINGTPPGNPPILDCVQTFIPGRAALKMVEFLVANGADVDATNLQGETALFQSVVDGRISLVRFLLRHGADPNIKSSNGRSTIEWLRWRLGETFGAEENARYAELLNLLTGSSSD
jgi:hypothetical protein